MLTVAYTSMLTFLTVQAALFALFLSSFSVLPVKQVQFLLLLAEEGPAVTNGS